MDFNENWFRGNCIIEQLVHDLKYLSQINIMSHPSVKRMKKTQNRPLVSFSHYGHLSIHHIISNRSGLLNVDFQI